MSLNAPELLDARLVLADIRTDLERRSTQLIAWRLADGRTAVEVDTLERLALHLHAGSPDDRELTLPRALSAAVEEVASWIPLPLGLTHYGRVLVEGIRAADGLRAEIDQELERADTDGWRPLSASASSRGRFSSNTRRQKYVANVSAG